MKQTVHYFNKFIFKLLTKKQEVIMKATRIFLMFALVSFALMSFATNDVDRSNLKTRISIVKAAHNPGLARAIYQQVDMSILGGDRVGIITTPVKYKNVTYIVFGTYMQWLTFFTSDRVERQSPNVDF